MSELWTSFANLFHTAGTFLVEVVRLLFQWSLAIFAVAWVAFAIDWRKMGPALRGGTAIPLVLIAAMIAFVWGFLAPSEAQFMGTVFPNFLWQVIATGLLLGLFLFCGWLQERYHWYPPEIELEPAGGHGHGHGDHGHGDHGHGDHGHGHDDHHQGHGHAEHHHGHDEEEVGPGDPPPVPAAGAHSH